MKARTFLALFNVIAMVVAGVLTTGCASGHKEFAYVVGQGTNEVFTFRQQRNGTLTPLGVPNFPAGSIPVAMAAHSSGLFLYVANSAGNNLTQLDINKGNGELSVPVSSSVVAPINPINIFNTGSTPIAVAMSPKDPFLFVANQGSGDITAFTVDPGSGSLSLIGTTPVVQQPAPPAPPIVVNPQSMAVSPKGDFLYVANAAQGTIAVLTIGAKGVLGYAPGSPFSVGASATPTSIVAESTGRFVYAADPAENAVLAFSVQSNGTLSPITGSPFVSGAQTSAVAVDPQGALLFAANTGSSSVSAFGIDSKSGALGQVSGSPFATGGIGPSALAVNTNTTVVYVTDQVTHDIAALGIQSNGGLKAIAGSPFPVAAGGVAITLVQE
ncbi:MAG TPA: beta-propeller fold lactonase family protein [Candidatus Angelobacter sp.]|nr:beta-propeller fold lactonase family protein [Candidatus Angelobacter sp.]